MFTFEKMEQRKAQPRFERAHRKRKMCRRVEDHGYQHQALRVNTFLSSTICGQYSISRLNSNGTSRVSLQLKVYSPFALYFLLYNPVLVILMPLICHDAHSFSTLLNFFTTENQEHHVGCFDCKSSSVLNSSRIRWQQYKLGFSLQYYQYMVSKPYVVLQLFQNQCNPQCFMVLVFPRLLLDLYM